MRTTIAVVVIDRTERLSTATVLYFAASAARSSNEDRQEASAQEFVMALALV